MKASSVAVAESPETNMPEAKPLTSLRVRAIKNGVYGHGNLGAIYRYGRTESYEGDIFTITPREVFATHPMTLIDEKTGEARWSPKGGTVIKDKAGKPEMRISSIEEQFSEDWMEPVPDNEPERVSGPQPAINRQIGEINSQGRSRD